MPPTRTEKGSLGKTERRAANRDETPESEDYHKLSRKELQVIYDRQKNIIEALGISQVDHNNPRPEILDLYSKQNEIERLLGITQQDDGTNQHSADAQTQFEGQDSGSVRPISTKDKINNTPVILSSKTKFWALTVVEAYINGDIVTPGSPKKRRPKPSTSSQSRSTTTSPKKTDAKNSKKVSKKVSNLFDDMEY